MPPGEKGGMMGENEMASVNMTKDGIAAIRT